VRRITKAALGSVAGCALVLGATLSANGDPGAIKYPLFEGDLVDFWTSTAGPFDGARAMLRVTESADTTGTGFKLSVEGIDPSASGSEFGAHLHIGPCTVEETVLPPPGAAPGWQAGPHYNHDAAESEPTPEISRKTEVWFNLVPNDHGDATDDTSVNFVPDDWINLPLDGSKLPVNSPGAMSVVIHLEPNDPKTGLAGGRQACLPLSVPQWATSP